MDGPYRQDREREKFMANLNQVGIVREEYRDLLRSEVGTGGPTLDEETLQGAPKRYREDVIINVCMSLHERLYGGIGMQPSEVLITSVEILDHLDTLGMEVRHKQ
jgi:hypothetical protein